MNTKIDCERISALLKSSYLDNELDGATREQVNRHLEECPACRRARENLAAISLLLRNTPRVNPPENIWARIQADIRPERVSRVNLPVALWRINPPLASWRINPPLASWRIKLSKNISAARFGYFFTGRNALALATAAVLVIAAVGFYFGSSRTDNGELAPSLSLLIGHDEAGEPNLNFGSNIEKYFL